MLSQLLAKKHPQAEAYEAGQPALRRTLGPWGLTALGIGAVIGGGIFVITGQAAADHAGPAIIISFILAAICSGFTALCYAEFATLIPVSGSAYSYAYATLGELAAWFIGWNLVLEYGVSASAVAVSWTGYFLSLLDHFGIHLPPALTNAPLDYVDGHLVVTGALFNLPAVAITMALTWVCYVGIRESTGANMAMVILKVSLIMIVIVVGARYVDPANWHPFIPEQQGPDKYGWSGILRGAAMVFFAYIGFEATSTAAQECKNPQRDMPFGTLASLVICTVLYIAMAAVLTGLLPYTQLGTDEPVVTAVRAHPQLAWLRWLVEVGALIGLSSVVLVMIIAQPRIFMIMGRDGLLPAVFTRIHPKHRTPHINTVITGIGIALLAAVFPLNVLGDLVSMGTLVAFCAVCGGVLLLRRTAPDLP
ncbi:MAG TPA: amino acid permease, partial [Mizugakiibacter sp.]